MAFWKEYCLRSNNLEIKTVPVLLPGALTFLRQHSLMQYTQLIDIVVSDVPGATNRFSVCYLLYSRFYNTKLHLIIKVDEITSLPSMVHLFESANWLEREVWDMFGIYFVGHPDLRRILTDYGFNGQPLRKDFPLSGFKEISYADAKQNLRYDNVVLAQEYRLHTNENNQDLPSSIY